MKSTVYFTRDLTPAAMLRLYGALGVKLAHTPASPATRTFCAPTS